MATRTFEKSLGMVLLGLVLLFWGTINVLANFSVFRAADDGVNFALLSALIFVAPLLLGVYCVFWGLSPATPNVPVASLAKVESGKTSSKKKKKKK